MQLRVGGDRREPDDGVPRVPRLRLDRAIPARRGHPGMVGGGVERAAGGDQARGPPVRQRRAGAQVDRHQGQGLQTAEPVRNRDPGAVEQGPGLALDATGGQFDDHGLRDPVVDRGPVDQLTIGCDGTLLGAAVLSGSLRTGAVVRLLPSQTVAPGRDGETQLAVDQPDVAGTTAAHLQPAYGSRVLRVSEIEHGQGRDVAAHSDAALVVHGRAQRQSRATGAADDDRGQRARVGAGRIQQHRVDAPFNGTPGGQGLRVPAGQTRDPDRAVQGRDHQVATRLDDVALVHAGHLNVGRRIRDRRRIRRLGRGLGGSRRTVRERGRGRLPGIYRPAVQPERTDHPLGLALVIVEQISAVMVGSQRHSFGSPKIHRRPTVGLRRRMQHPDRRRRDDGSGCHRGGQGGNNWDGANWAGHHSP